METQEEETFNGQQSTINVQRKSRQVVFVYSVYLVHLVHLVHKAFAVALFSVEAETGRFYD